MNTEEIYAEYPKSTPSMEFAYKFESKTRQRPFVIATDLPSNENDPDAASRLFVVFHDVDHFLMWRPKMPFIHEIIYCPKIFKDEEEFEFTHGDELTKGRLIFDFDLTEPLPAQRTICSLMPNVTVNDYVPANFNQVIEYLVTRVFTDYYVKVDTSKFKFIWQTSNNPHKFSKHLIIKHCYFNEYWMKQMKVFYALLKKIAQEENLAEYLIPVDFQMARRNATFRFIGAKKINGYVLSLDPCVDPTNLTIKDCFVGIYDFEILAVEQQISLDNLNYAAINEAIEDSRECMDTPLEVDFRNDLEKHLFTLDEVKDDEIEIDSQQAEMAMNTFSAWNCTDNAFAIRDQRGSFINLDRRRRAPCPISGRIHDNENAYLILHKDGRILFKCYRDCKCEKTGFSSVVIGRYKDIAVNPEISKKFCRLRVPDAKIFNFKVTIKEQIDVKVEKVKQPRAKKDKSIRKTTYLNATEIVIPECLMI